MSLIVHESFLPAMKYWALDPLFCAHVKLLAAHLSVLRAADQAPDGDVVWLSNHPIRYVDIVGVCISVDPKHAVPGHDTRISFTLDDGSGLAECVCWLNDDGDRHSNWPSIAAKRQLVSQCRLGTVLHVLGKLSHFRGQRQVVVERCWPETDLLAEAMHWARCQALWRDCYSTMFRVDSYVSHHEQQQQPAQPPAAQQLEPSKSSEQLELHQRELTKAVREIFAAAANCQFSASDVVSSLPASAKQPFATAGNLRQAVDEALRALDEDQSEIFLCDTRRGREQLWKFAG